MAKDRYPSPNWRPYSYCRIAEAVHTWIQTAASVALIDAPIHYIAAFSLNPWDVYQDRGSIQRWQNQVPEFLLAIDRTHPAIAASS